MEEGGIIYQAVRANATISGGETYGARGLPFAELPSNQRCAAVPISIGGEVVAVLYADGPVVSPDRLEIFARYAARCLEAMTAFKAVRLLTMPLSPPNGPSSFRLPDDNRYVRGDAAAGRHTDLLALSS
jgi:hypothetical protein